ncbi:antitoxin [Dactylosporangium sp. AC04546]|uniref:antitoxin n=1 Tax=Dactylosporangium sp. AC04546 TaxID=2862460 RepID=UPI001EDD306D|nr:antitoxin [Dactylosporangium sp. AC04546]WVK84664.1 antitoxin [Dactylosporangium sp. AC04546]
MSKLVDKAKELLGKHDDKVDQGLDKAAEQADRRTGQQYTDKIEKGSQVAKEHTGEGDTTR